MNILIPDSCLRRFIKTKASPEDIKKYLSLCGPSVEKVEKIGADDCIYHVEITSNRVDMASVIGFAREIRAILPRFGFPVELTVPGIVHDELPQTSVPILIEDPDRLCERLLGIVIDGVKISDSPKYIKDSLERSGIRSLNNIIDITNYIMLIYGHPMHVFDYDRVGTGKLCLRKAKNGETFTSLDDKTFSLTKDDVVIDDGTGRIVDLPGIMGAKNSVVMEGTKRIILFSEANDPLIIRSTSMRLSLRSYAATLNEKGPDAIELHDAFLKAVALIKEVSPAKPVSRIIDVYPLKKKVEEIRLDTHKVRKILGIDLTVPEIEKILLSLQFSVKTISDSLIAVTPPSWRFPDVSLSSDLIEEIARIYGYHNLPETLPKIDPPIENSDDRRFSLEDKVKILFKHLGFSETYSYSFISESDIRNSGQDPTSFIALTNPISDDLKYLRTSLFPSLIKIYSNNQKRVSDTLRIFELANVYLLREKTLPEERTLLAVIDPDDFFTVKGKICAILDEIIGGKIRFIRSHHHFGHPKKSAFIERDGETIGFIGNLNPTIASSFNIGSEPTLIELDLSILAKLPKISEQFIPLSPHPKIMEDITLKTPEYLEVGPVIEKIIEFSTLIEDVQIIDKFADQITFRLNFRSPRENLKKEEVSDIKQKLIIELKERFHLTIREDPKG